MRCAGGRPPPVRVGALAAAVVSIAVTVLVATGCAAGGGRPDGGPKPASPSAGVAASGRSEFQRDVTDSVAIAENYWRARFAAAGLPFRPVQRVVAYQRDGEVDCGGQPLLRNNAAYCSAGDFIAYDVDWAAAVFTRIGDAFVYFLLGHEYAHGVQVRFGLRYRYTIEQELQADCMAGAYLGDSVRAGQLLLEEGDVQELRAGLRAVGDDPGQPWFSPGAHGTGEQRANAFFAGYQSSVRACGIGR